MGARPCVRMVPRLPVKKVLIVAMNVRAMGSVRSKRAMTARVRPRCAAMTAAALRNRPRRCAGMMFARVRPKFGAMIAALRPRLPLLAGAVDVRMTAAALRHRSRRCPAMVFNRVLLNHVVMWDVRPRFVVMIAALRLLFLVGVVGVRTTAVALRHPSRRCVAMVFNHVLPSRVVMTTARLHRAGAVDVRTIVAALRHRPHRCPAMVSNRVLLNLVVMRDVRPKFVVMIAALWLPFLVGVGDVRTTAVALRNHPYRCVRRGFNTAASRA